VGKKTERIAHSEDSVTNGKMRGQVVGSARARGQKVPEQVRRSVLITRLSSVPFTMLAADRRAVDRYENPLFNYLLWDVEMSSKLFSGWWL